MKELQQILARLAEVQAELTEVHAELTEVRAEQKVLAESFTALETEVKSYKKVKQMKIKYHWCRKSDPTVNRPEKISAFVTDEPSSLEELKHTLQYHNGYPYMSGDIHLHMLCWKDSEGDYINLNYDEGMKLAFDECKKIGMMNIYGRKTQ